MADRYFLHVKADVGGHKMEIECTKEQYMNAERAAGFHSKTPGEPATGFFSSGPYGGRIEYDVEAIGSDSK